MADLKLSVDVATLDTEEVFTVLMQHFGTSSMESGRARFGRLDNWIDVEVSKSGRIRAIRHGSRVTVDELTAIRREIDEALVIGQVPAVGQRVGFCLTPIMSFYKYCDKFLIMPVPSGAPRPDVRVADHPFLFQYAYIWSPNIPVRYQRREHQARAYFRLLDLLSRMRIYGGPQAVHHAWIMLTSEDPSGFSPRWLQLGYTYPGLALEIDGFSDTSGLEPMTFFPARDEFAHPRLMGDPLMLPDDIERNLDIGFSLGREDLGRFNRALIFLEHAKSVGSESRSLAYISLVMAIEALMDKPQKCRICDQALLESVSRCSACGQPVFGTTQAFRKFMENHAPIIRGEPGIRNRLYSLRSALAHGEDVMLADASPLAIFGTYVREEAELESRLYLIAGAAVRSWLQSRA
jgi:hypothetical protein